MQQLNLPIVQKTYELYQELHQFQRAIPKADRYTLWQRCENTTLEILEELIRTICLPQVERRQPLFNVSVQVNMLRVFVRLSFEVRAISQKKYFSLEKKIEEIGRMLGGWIKASGKSASTNS